MTNPFQFRKRHRTRYIPAKYFQVCPEAGRLGENEIFRITSVLHKVKEIVELNNLMDSRLTKDIDDAMDILSINTKESIVIPNTSHKKKVYKKYEVNRNTVDLMADTKNWTSQTDLSSLLTIVLNFHSYNQTQTQELYREIISRVKFQTIIIAARQHNRFPHGSNTVMTFIPSSIHETEGQVWNMLVGLVQTPFVLVGRDLATIAGQEKLFRLLKVMPSLGSAIIGGATRTREGGRWSLNCFQMLHYNYSIFYQSGYHKSDHGCLFCDFFWGPFIAEKAILIDNPFSVTLKKNLVFQDFFFWINSKQKFTSAVCPDAMFEMIQSCRQFPTKREWLPFAKEHGVNRIKHPDGDTVTYTCKELGQTFPTDDTGKMNSPCALQYLSELLKLVFKICEQNGIYCQLGFGHLLGK